jgi:hypothetical protein
MLRGHNISFEEYRKLSPHDRYHLQKSAAKFLQMLYGSGAEMLPDE